MIDIRKDPYLLRHWRNCPEVVVDRMYAYVVPAAQNDPSPYATDTIVKGACEFEWYLRASRSDRHKFHSLVGHVVRIARRYIVARTSSGRIIRLPSEDGPHKTFTMQVPWWLSLLTQ